MPIDVTEASFGEEVLERSREVPVVLDIWAKGDELSLRDAAPDPPSPNPRSAFGLVAVWGL